MRFHYSRAHRLYLAPALGLVLAATMTACSSGGSSSSSRSAATSAPAATSASSSASATGSAVSQITANWEAFFNPATPNSKRVQLLENGSSFASALTAFAKSPLAAQVTSKV